MLHGRTGYAVVKLGIPFLSLPLPLPFAHFALTPPLFPKLSFSLLPLPFIPLFLPATLPPSLPPSLQILSSFLNCFLTLCTPSYPPPSLHSQHPSMSLPVHLHSFLPPSLSTSTPFLFPLPGRTINK